MLELNQIDELNENINLLEILEIAKNSALIGNEILKNNYKKNQNEISSYIFLKSINFISRNSFFNKKRWG